MPPRGRERRDRQSVERERPKHAVAMRGNQGLEALPQPVSLERCAVETGLE